jgi:hypothetical protein
MNLLRVFLVAQRPFRRARVLPSLVVLGDDLRGRLGAGEIVLAMRRLCRGGGVASARVFGGAHMLGAIDLFRNAPRGCAREVAHRELTATESISLDLGRRFDSVFEIALTACCTLCFVARRVGVPQRFRQRADLLVDRFFADSPKRVERVFTGQDASDPSSLPH